MRNAGLQDGRSIYRFPVAARVLTTLQNAQPDCRTPTQPPTLCVSTLCRMRLKCDGTRAETRFRLQAKRTSPFKSAGATFQSTAGSRGVRISGSNAGYTMFRGSVKSAAYPLHSPVSSSLPSRASPCTITFQLGSMWVKTGAV